MPCECPPRPGHSGFSSRHTRKGRRRHRGSNMESRSGEPVGERRSEMQMRSPFGLIEREKTSSRIDERKKAQSAQNEEGRPALGCAWAEFERACGTPLSTETNAYSGRGYRGKASRAAQARPSALERTDGQRALPVLCVGGKAGGKTAGWLRVVRQSRVRWEAGAEAEAAKAHEAASSSPRSEARCRLLDGGRTQAMLQLASLAVQGTSRQASRLGTEWVRRRCKPDLDPGCAASVRCMTSGKICVISTKQAKAPTLRRCSSPLLMRSTKKVNSGLILFRLSTQDRHDTIRLGSGFKWRPWQTKEKRVRRNGEGQGRIDVAETVAGRYFCLPAESADRLEIFFTRAIHCLHASDELSGFTPMS